MQTKFRQEQKGDAEVGWRCNLPAPGLDEGSVLSVLQNRLWFRKEPSGPGPGAAEALKVLPWTSHRGCCCTCPHSQEKNPLPSQRCTADGDMSCEALCVPACFPSFLTQRSHGKSQHMCGNRGI